MQYSFSIRCEKDEKDKMKNVFPKVEASSIFQLPPSTLQSNKELDVLPQKVL
jgi:hypothetical protein